MELATILLFVLAGLLVVGGTVASVVNLPGIWLVLLGYVVSGFASGWGEFSIILVAVVAIVCVISSVIDNIMSLAVSRKFGATRWGLVGAFVGSVVGLLVANFLGMLMGSFVGAFIAELVIMKRAWKASAKSGAGALVGWFVGMAVKFAVAIGLLMLWAVVLFW